MWSQGPSVQRHTYTVIIKRRFYWILSVCVHAMPNRPSKTIIFEFSYSGISFRDFQSKHSLCILSFSRASLDYLILPG